MSDRDRILALLNRLRVEALEDQGWGYHVATLEYAIRRVRRLKTTAPKRKRSRG